MRIILNSQITALLYHANAVAADKFVPTELVRSSRQLRRNVQESETKAGWREHIIPTAKSIKESINQPQHG
jgi:uncharacterized circularly permuted ATP-grasp superfamily protein